MIDTVDEYGLVLRKFVLEFAPRLPFIASDLPKQKENGNSHQGTNGDECYCGRTKS